MTEIQILFFCGLSVFFIGVMFLMLWKVHSVKMQMENLKKEHAAEMGKMKDLCNKIYEKLKEVVEKVNPLLANDVSANNSEDIYEAAYVPVDEESPVI